MSGGLKCDPFGLPQTLRQPREYELNTDIKNFAFNKVELLESGSVGRQCFQTTMVSINF